MEIIYFNQKELLDDLYDDNDNYEEEYDNNTSEYYGGLPCEIEQMIIQDKIIDKYFPNWDDGISDEVIDKKKNWEFHQKFKRLIPQMRKEIICGTLLTFVKRIINSKKYIKNNFNDVKLIYYYMPSFLFPIYGDRIYDIDDGNNDLDNIYQNETGDHNYADFLMPYGTSYYKEYCDCITMMIFIMNDGSEIFFINDKIKEATKFLERDYHTSYFKISNIAMRNNYINSYYKNKLFAKYENGKVILQNETPYQYMSFNDKHKNEFDSNGNFKDIKNKFEE